MTVSASPAPARDWWAQPRVMLPLLGCVLVLVMLLTPEQNSGRIGDGRLSAHLAGSLGARALKDAAARLGWRVVLRDSAATPRSAPGATVHVVLAPVLPISPAQAHQYLDAVRGGDGLLLALGDRNPLSDSLGLRHSRTGGWLVPAPEDTADCGRRGRDLVPALWPDGRVHLWALRWARGRAPGAVTFARVGTGQQVDSPPTEEAAAGFALGRGRVVAVSDPDLLRNDVLRRCAWGADVIAVRMLEWLRDGGETPRTTLAFDEYHQGFGPRRSTTSVTRRFLTGHPVGRTILQCVLAALVLLLAVAPRAIVPRARARAERRDPLEQADALAHAYEQVRATRTATQRLLRGVRSRVERAGVRSRTDSDDAFLAMAASNDPTLGDDVALVGRALRSADAAGELPVIGEALRRIEHSLQTTTNIIG